MNNLVDTIKEQVTCKAFAEHVGLRFNRSGYCVCPFHGEKTPSLKVYADGKGWYCFGCGRGGDVINFAKIYYATDFNTAIKHIAHEFDIPFDGDSMSPSDRLKNAVMQAQRKSSREKEEREKQAVEREYWALFDKSIEIEKAINDYAPETPDDEFDQRFVRAIMERENVQYELSLLEERRNKLWR